MTNDQPLIRHVVGVMTGTSIDGIDAALVRITGRGLDMKAELVWHLSKPLGNIGTGLRAAAEQKPMTAGELARLAWEFGHLHVEVIQHLLAKQPMPDFICVHGQTVFHQPPVSWQLVNPTPIATRFNCPVVYDLRQADLACGGQGAPITPIADWILFREAGKRRAVINLGGYCNVTIVPPQRAGTSSCRSIDELHDIHGFDVCACNHVLDTVARTALGKPFDEGGAAAAAGRAKPQAVDDLLKILNQQRSGGRSLGTGDEAITWVKTSMKSSISANDLAATAVNAIARCIADTVTSHDVDELIVAGGGARNTALITVLRHAAGLDVHRTDAFGVPIEARESVAFAVLGTLCADGVPITLPQVTGCSAPAPRSGTWCGPVLDRGLPPRG